jgi:hypothetical protein
MGSSRTLSYGIRGEGAQSIKKGLFYRPFFFSIGNIKYRTSGTSKLALSLPFCG